MAIDYTGFAFAKPEPRKARKERDRALRLNHVAKVRAYVFARERNLCRCCRWRPAQSMHELRPKSLGGRVSRRNSIAVCGDGVRGCHGRLQRHEVAYLVGLPHLGAEAVLWFEPRTTEARDWMKLGGQTRLESAPMVAYES